MPIVMVRIDDRLIHGQVVVGWCSKLKPDRLVVCDDEVAQSAWLREIYEDAAPDYKTSICTIEETVRLFKSETLRFEKVVLIVPSPNVVARLLERSLKFDKVIVGGMHHQVGKRKIADFIYVDEQDIKHFKTLVDKDIELVGKDVPNCKSINVPRLLGFTK